VDTSEDFVGLKTQDGLTAPCWADQYASVKLSYGGDPFDKTLSSAKSMFKDAHYTVISFETFSYITT
jgi:hypothetical protein